MSPLEIKLWVLASCKPWCLRQRSLSIKGRLVDTNPSRWWKLPLSKWSPTRQSFSWGATGTIIVRVRDRYRLDFIQHIVQSFWKKWTHDYFPGLIIWSKRHRERRKVKEGDIILTAIDALRGDWRIGIVTEAHPSHDNKVQQFNVSYKNGVRVTLQSTWVLQEQFTDSWCLF